jgi:GPH family glycoside/pentoside/hexuronide:cation symporter
LPGSVVPNLSTRFLYGFYALPLAFVALPVYVHIPALYARETGLSLAVIGVILLGTRLFDAVLDPWLGVLVDRWHQRLRFSIMVLLGSVPLALGFYLLVSPSLLSPALWLAGSLMLTYIAFSAVMIAHQSWGALLGRSPAARLAVTSMREGLGLLGVIIAAILPVLLVQRYSQTAWPIMAALFTGLLTLGSLLLFAVPQNTGVTAAANSTSSYRQVFASPRFRALLLAFVLNGIAASLPSQLVVFFIEDVLKAKAYEGAFLALYFIAGALAMPLWTWLAAKIGQCQAWMVSMAITVFSFICALFLGAGDVLAFGAISVATGLALGADLAIPPALLATVIHTNAHNGAEGRYFGIWSFCTKINLALAAGIALPLIAAFGYTPGGNQTTALTLTYCLLPCGLKLLAAWATWRFARQFPECSTGALALKSL